MGPDDRRAGRELGIALSAKGPEAAAEALPRLEAALAERPDDLPARAALGFVLGTLGRADEGLEAFESVLAEDPGRETTLAAAGLLASQSGQPDRAIGHWRRLLEVDPERAAYHAALGHDLALKGLYSQAAEACREALRLNPADFAARSDLVACYARLGSIDRARAEFETLLGFYPEHRAELSAWFESLP